jgi:hypothetical protein
VSEKKAKLPENEVVIRKKPKEVYSTVNQRVAARGDFVKQLCTLFKSDG